MSTRVVIRNAAERDIQNAIDWYVENAPEHADRLAADLQATIDRIRDSPTLSRAVYRDIRRAALPRFPYLVWSIYFDESDTVHIVAVSHRRQYPEQTRRRLS